MSLEEITYPSKIQQIIVTSLEQVKDTIEEMKISEDDLEALTLSLKMEAMEICNRVGESRTWLLKQLDNTGHIEETVSLMRHIPGGQIEILKFLNNYNPNSVWCRGGTLRTARDWLGIKDKSKIYTPDELNSFVIDGGANGTLTNPKIALGFLSITHRNDPAIYILTTQDLIDGLEKGQIFVVSEHPYDLCVKSNGNNKNYINFCRDNLIIYMITG